MRPKVVNTVKMLDRFKEGKEEEESWEGAERRVRPKMKTVNRVGKQGE